MEAADLGLLVLRCAVGLLLAGHGAQKLLGWFGGHGVPAVAAWFDAIGFRPGRPMAIVAGAVELVGGLLLVLGLLTPLAAAAVVGTMVVAATTHRGRGVWATSGGYELALVYGILATALALGGPGEASVDALLGLDEVWTAALGAVLCILPTAAALVLVVRAGRALARPAHDADAIDIREPARPGAEVSTTEEAPSRSGR